MRRVAQSFVIATKTKIDISKVKIPDHINDAYFRRQKTNLDKSKDGIFATGEISVNKLNFYLLYSSFFRNTQFLNYEKMIKKRLMQKF